MNEELKVVGEKDIRSTILNNTVILNLFQEISTGCSIVSITTSGYILPGLSCITVN